MKKILLLILITCTSQLLEAKNIVTTQFPDKVIYNGIEYNLNSNPLEPYFDKHPENRPTMVSTALWRGYVGYFEIINKELYLIDMKIPIHEKGEDGAFKEKWISIYRIYFPRQKKVKVDWYSGILILPHGKLVEYVHQSYASIYSKYLLIEIENGNFNEARKYDHKEFINFKNRQFEIFEKTEEYKKLFINLKEKDKSDKDENIKAFIFDFVINYTTKFLTE